MADQFIKLPDGSMGRFRADMPDSQIRQLIERDFPQAYKKQSLPPEAEQALRSIPDPYKRDSWGRSTIPQFTKGELALQGLQQGPLEGGRTQRFLAQMTGIPGIPRAVRGAYTIAEGGKENFYQGGSEVMGGTMKALTPLAAIGSVARPLMGVAAIAGGELGGRGAAGATKLAGGSPAAQNFAGAAGGLIGAGAAGGGEFLRERYLRAVDMAKSDLRASRGYGASVDEQALHKAAEAKVQVDIAKGNTLPELSRTAAHTLIKAAQSGALIRRDEQLPLQFGEHAQPEAPGKPENKGTYFGPQATRDLPGAIDTSKFPAQKGKGTEVPGIVDATKAAAEVKTRPMTPVEKVKEIAKKEEVKQPIQSKSYSGYQIIEGRKPEKIKGTIPERPAGLNATSPEAIEEARQRQALRDTQLEVTNRATSGSQMGRQAAPPEASQPTIKPIQATEAPTKGGEPVRGTEKAPLSEPRSLQGDLGERPPAPAKKVLNPMERLAIQRERIQKYVEEHPGVSKQHAATIVAEQMRKEQGSLGGGAPRDPNQRRADREEKINKWINYLRDPNADPMTLDSAYKMLRAYGVEGDEIIRRVSGAEGFAKTGDDRPSTEEVSYDGKIRDLYDSLVKSFEKENGRKPNDKERTELFDHATTHVDAGDRLPEPSKEALEERIGQSPGDIREEFEAMKTAFRQRQGREPNEQEKSELFHAANDSMMGFYPSQKEIQEGREGVVNMQAWAEGRRQGAEDITRVKSPDVEWLEKQAALRDPRATREDERGSLSFKPLKVDQTPLLHSLQELTKHFDQVIKAEPNPDSTMIATERAVNKFFKDSKADFYSDWAGVQMALGKLTGHIKVFEHLRENYMNEPQLNDYRSAIGRFSGSLNRNNWAINDFIKKGKKFLPDEGARKAISRWVEAGGDDQILADRSARSKGQARADYERARTLTGQEKEFAKLMTDHLDHGLKVAVDQGVMSQGLENYIPHIWEKPKDQTKAAAYFSSLERGSTLNTTFNAAKKRVFDSYFEGEQAGFKPKNTDILYLVASWDKALSKTLASRNFVRDLSNGLAKDGRPIVAPYGKGNPLYGTVSPEEGESPSAYFIRPKAGPDETADYKVVDHPAMTKWTWITKDESGNPIYLKGDLRVHPDHAQTLNNVVNRGKWAAEHPVITALLKGSAFFKQSLLAGLPVNPFHQIQEGLHAAFHKVNPFNPGQIDMADPRVNALLDHGLVIANTDPIANFNEGVSAGGIWGKIPGIGRLNQKYTEYLFQDYIPRLKTKMAVEAYERNLHRYQGAVARGDMTTNMIAELTANQANAAFGELNYMMLGRSPGTQAALRMMLFAPDFFEARARFVGQALRPYGREQYSALLRGAAGLYITARILNKIYDDDYHWDEPFALIANGYRYTLRNLPEDAWRAMTDTGSFITHRINPIALKSQQFLAGTDDYGRKRALGERAINLAHGLLTPFQAEGWVNSWLHGENRDKVGGLLQSFAVSRSIYRTKAGAMAHQFAIEDAPDTASHHIMETVRDLQSGQMDGQRLSDLISEGKMNPADIKTATRLAKLPELYRDYSRLPVEQKAKVYAAATPEERATIRHYARKELDVTRLLPEQRAEFMNNFANQ